MGKFLFHRINKLSVNTHVSHTHTFRLNKTINKSYNYIDMANNY